MHIRRSAVQMLVMAGALWLAACGGDVTTGPPPAGSAPATPAAVIALSTEGTLAPGTTIGGLGVTVNLPDSVSVKRDGSGNVDSSVVTTSGVAAGQATVIALYSAATATEPAKLHIALASGSSGMTVGEFAMITCTVPAGDGPAAADFSLSDFAPVDTSGAAIPSLSADLRSVE